MTPDEAEAYLYRHIPLSRALQVHVARLDRGGVRLEAPLGPNLNHRGTAFGGSLSALGILAGWLVVHAALRREELTARLVIARHEVDFTAPAEERLEASAPTPEPDAWARFVAAYRRRGRGRIEVACRLASAGRSVGACRGRYVALPLDA